MLDFEGNNEILTIYEMYSKVPYIKTDRKQKKSIILGTTNPLEVSSLRKDLQGQL